MEGKAVFGGGQGKGGEADNKLNIDSIIARLLEGEPLFKTILLQFHDPFLNFHANDLCQNLVMKLAVVGGKEYCW